MANNAKKPRKRPSSQIGALTLIDVDIDFDPELESEHEIEASFQARITQPTAVEVQDETVQDAVVFQAHMRIGKGRKDAEDFTTMLTATYFCAMRYKDASEEEILELAKFVAQTTIWNNFTSLAAIVTQQMGSEFPVLPPHPGSVAVSVLENEEEISE